ncbi:MAG: hypothetical protein ACXQS8_04260 [Candidatus Helarchaeales archaeon]
MGWLKLAIKSSRNVLFKIFKWNSRATLIGSYGSWLHVEIVYPVPVELPRGLVYQ